MELKERDSCVAWYISRLNLVPSTLLFLRKDIPTKMTGNGSIIQAQFSLANSVFSATGNLVELLSKSARDDVQCQAVAALEALSSTMLVEPQRIDEALEALSCKDKFTIVERFKLTLGLCPGGISDIFRNHARQCLPSLLLIAGLKTLMDDAEIGSILYEELVFTGLVNRPEFRVTRSQLTSVVQLLSGFTDSISPHPYFSSVGDAVRQSTATPGDAVKFFWKPETKVIAEIYTRVFEGLRKENVDRITLEGKTGGVLLSSTLWWLLENDFSLNIDKKRVCGSTVGKVVLDLNTTADDKHWSYREWRQESVISNVIVRLDESDQARLNLQFYPASSTRHIVQCQYDLTNQQTELVGEVAAGLVHLVMQVGQLEEAFELPGDTVPFTRVCQNSFISRTTNCLDFLGWNAEFYGSGAQEFASTAIAWMEKGCPGVENIGERNRLYIGDPKKQRKPLGDTNQVLMFGFVNEVYASCNFKNGSWAGVLELKVTEPATHIAAEVLSSAVCSKLPQSRAIRACQLPLHSMNASWIMGLSFAAVRLAGSKCDPVVNFPAAQDYESVPDLRVRAMKALIPGSPNAFHRGEDIDKRDLVYSKNGYAAFPETILKLSSLPSVCAAIVVQPGYIRWEDEPATFEHLRASQCDEDNCDVVDRFETPQIYPFDKNGEFQGLLPLNDPTGLTCEHEISSYGKTLEIQSYIRQSGTNSRTPVDWIQSISALVFATHMNSYPLPSYAEQALAYSWHEQDLWRTLKWNTADENVFLQEQTRQLGMTYGNEELRFFLAGRGTLGRKPYHKLIIRHGTTPLIKCIQEGLESEPSLQDIREWKRRLGGSRWRGWLVIC